MPGHKISQSRRQFTAATFIVAVLFSFPLTTARATAFSTPEATAIPTPPLAPTDTLTPPAAPTVTATDAPLPTEFETTPPGSTPTPTEGLTVTATETLMPTLTSSVTAAVTSTPAPTGTSAGITTPTSTASPTATGTATPTAIPTAAATATPGPTALPTATTTTFPAQTATPAATATPTPPPAPGPTGTTAVTSTPTPTLTSSPTPTANPPVAATPIPTATSTPGPIAIATAILTPTQTQTLTLTPAATVTSISVPAAPLAVVINELGWAGTNASVFDEWIELHNPGPDTISLEGWTLTDGGSIRIVFPPEKTISAGGFLLLERADDNTISDIVADFIYVGDLSDGGETVILLDASGQVVDTANGNGGPWPAGSSSPIASMERLDPLAADSDGNWVTNDGIHRNGQDANGQPVNGTPRMPNSNTFPTSTPTSTASSTPTSTRTATPTASRTPTHTGSPTATATSTPTQTSTPTPTRTQTPTSTPSTTPTATAAFPLAVVISELGWAGTDASAFDEWIELHNPGPETISLEGWTLTDGDDLNVLFPAGVTIQRDGFFLLERTDDITISDIPADLIYTGGLTNTGETLTLLDATGQVVDSANGDGGPWPAGSDNPKSSMERLDPLAADNDGNWLTNDGIHRNGHDANGQPINGSPRMANSSVFPTNTPSATGTLTATGSVTPSSTPTLTPTPTLTLTPSPVSPLTLVINELGWAGTDASAFDEWIELHNPGPDPISLEGWTLTDGADLNLLFPPGAAIQPGGFFLLERTDDTTISDIPADLIYTGGMTNTGETLTLLDATGQVVDTVNRDGGPWPAGSDSPKSSMERLDPLAADADGNWLTNDGIHRNGYDANGQPINGSPRMPNSSDFPTSTPTLTPTPGSTGTATDIPTPTLTLTPTTVSPLSVVINELGWAGTDASAFDEWIELYNPSLDPISLDGWTLTDFGDLNLLFPAGAIIQPGGFFLLERTDDTTISDITADLIYTGGLTNTGETLTLLDATGQVVDTANGDGGPWPAGSDNPKSSMERLDPLAADGDGNWLTNDGIHRNGHDANGQPVNASPRMANSSDFPTSTPTLTPTPGSTGTATDIPTLTPTQTLSPTLTLTPGPVSPLAVVLNELGWAGTDASAFDEWIELHNPGPDTISLEGWTLTDFGDLNLLFPAGAAIQPGGFFLLERTDDTAISDIPADLIYTGGLNNEGEHLQLLDPLGEVIDTANGTGGWPAGDVTARASMERVTPGPDSPSNWATNLGYVLNGQDRDGNPVQGTPRETNSTRFPTPVPTAIPIGLALNEFLPHPASDWNDDGNPDADDEFIELYNFGSSLIDLGGLFLDDAEGGSAPYMIPEGTFLNPGRFLAFFGAQTGIALNDDGDTVRLLSSNSAVLDQKTYDRDSDPDMAWGRLPDGTGQWNSHTVPTPGSRNLAISKPSPPTPVPSIAAREWSDGAWLIFKGRVAVLPGLFSPRLINLQDDAGGLYVYLGSGTWPPMKLGMEVTALGYLRTRTGQRELYVRNLWHVGVGAWDVVELPEPRLVNTGDIGLDRMEGDLVTIEGQVVSLEESAFWLDDGSGQARVFFGAATGVERPAMRSGEYWRATGVVGEFTTAASTSPGYRLRIRLPEDVVKLVETDGRVLPERTPEGPEELAPGATEEAR